MTEVCVVNAGFVVRVKVSMKAQRQRRGIKRV